MAAVGELDSERKAARRLFNQGRVQDAFGRQRAVVERAVADGRATADDYLMLGLLAYNLQDYPATKSALSDGLQAFPDDPRLRENFAIALMRLDDFEAAAAHLSALVEQGYETPNVYDALAQCHGKLRRWDEARACGSAALRMKRDMALEDGFTAELPEAPPKPFDPTARERNIISFSLWGQDRRYLLGAVANAELAPHVYPSWRCRFYVGRDVPQEVVGRLEERGAQVRVMRPSAHPFAAYLWRFQVMDDPEVDRFLVRDVDALLNVQERVAVDAWLESGKHFHMMRDWYTHTALMLAGLWGGVPRLLPDLDTLLKRFRPKRHPTKQFDQDFLMYMVWPTASRSCLVHDSQFDLEGTEPFPSLGRLPPSFHVGQARALRRWGV